MKRKHKKIEEPAEPVGYQPAPARPIPPGLARFRLPDSASPEAAALSDRALQRIEDVLEERVHPSAAPGVLKAAGMIRDEFCGPIPKDINLKGHLSLQDIVRAATKPSDPEGDGTP